MFYIFIFIYFVYMHIGVFEEMELALDGYTELLSDSALSSSSSYSEWSGDSVIYEDERFISMPSEWRVKLFHKYCDSLKDTVDIKNDNDNNNNNNNQLQLDNKNGDIMNEEKANVNAKKRNIDQVSNENSSNINGDDNVNGEAKKVKAEKGEIDEEGELSDGELNDE